MSEELRREVVVARRRRRRHAVIAAVALALPAQLGWLLFATHPRERVRVERAPTAALLPIPVPLPVERVVAVPAARATCPPPRRDAPFAAPAPLPEPIERVRPSVTNAGWIAAWNADHVFISLDAGRSWQRRLDGPGTVQDVTFDCFGRALALRDDRIGIREGDAERWAHVPGISPVDELYGRDGVLLGGGPDVVVIGHPKRSPDDTWRARLAVSHDLGATWRTRDLVEYWEGGEVRGRQHEDGTILAMIPQADCMGDTPWVFRWRDGALEELWSALDANLAFFGDRMMSSTEWQRIGADATHALPALDGVERILEGPYPIVIAGGKLHRIAGTRAIELPWQLGPDADGVSADPAGRIWSVVCGRPHVATRTPPAPCSPDDAT